MGHNVESIYEGTEIDRWSLAFVQCQINNQKPSDFRQPCFYKCPVGRSFMNKKKQEEKRKKRGLLTGYEHLEKHKEQMLANWQKNPKNKGKKPSTE